MPSFLPQHETIFFLAFVQNFSSPWCCSCIIPLPLGILKFPLVLNYLAFSSSFVLIWYWMSVDLFVSLRGVCALMSSSVSQCPTRCSLIVHKSNWGTPVVLVSCWLISLLADHGFRGFIGGNLPKGWTVFHYVRLLGHFPLAFGYSFWTGVKLLVVPNIQLSKYGNELVQDQLLHTVF